ncbi:uncharacterized protein YqcC (DUF446 family) [Sinobacterium caligoides]|uniref:Uncharacterized protein YqcC (DUF446 family) n=1 Tax=Sinobacterium caligoides TaxID=933926 RepID=A0A3N2D510_9GAMM|nr:YqcC family protein [Sinobacterium caligoides]ROR94867.1 uncharacterized protein YqcC (DUF446 family) [Sinobacterium caligoides]
MSDRYTVAQQFMLAIEAELKVMGLWSERRPSERALSSLQPFCVDTLAFEQWLQFVFIERMLLLIEQRGMLPSSFGLAPMSEQSFSPRGVDSHDLTRLLERLDEALSC